MMNTPLLGFMEGVALLWGFMNDRSCTAWSADTLTVRQSVWCLKKGVHGASSNDIAARGGAGRLEPRIERLQRGTAARCIRGWCGGHCRGLVMRGGATSGSQGRHQLPSGEACGAQTRSVSSAEALTSRSHTLPQSPCLPPSPPLPPAPAPSASTGGHGFQKATARTAASCRRRHRSCCAVSTFHTRTVLSWDPEASRRPSCEKATALTHRECPCKGRDAAHPRPGRTSHSRSVSSRLPLASSVASGEKATALAVYGSGVRGSGFGVRGQGIGARGHGVRLG